MLIPDLNMKDLIEIGPALDRGSFDLQAMYKFVTSEFGEKVSFDQFILFSIKYIANFRTGLSIIVFAKLFAIYIRNEAKKMNLKFKTKTYSAEFDEKIEIIYDDKKMKLINQLDDDYLASYFTAHVLWYQTETNQELKRRILYDLGKYAKAILVNSKRAYGGYLSSFLFKRKDAYFWGVDYEGIEL